MQIAKQNDTTRTVDRNLGILTLKPWLVVYGFSPLVLFDWLPHGTREILISFFLIYIGYL
jgi:hypothetical protein